LEFAPPAVWNLLVNVVNCNLALGETCQEQRDKRRKDTNPAELLRFYGI